MTNRRSGAFTLDRATIRKGRNLEFSVGDSLDRSELIVREGVDEDGPSEFSIEARVIDPPRGSSVELKLGSGLRLLEGELIRALDDGTNSLGWCVALRAAAPGRFRYSVNLRSREGQAVASEGRDVTAVACGRIEFDPAEDGFAFDNRADLFGRARPPQRVFDGTFEGGPSLLRSRLFDGLYESVFQTGLCTGMARAASWFATADNAGRAVDRTTDDDETREIIQLLHGRQLSDRALLSSAYALLTGGPRRVFRKFREQALTAGRSPIAIDVGVPKLTRSDFLRAVVRQGHTVVPYAYRLLPDGIAHIHVYDPVYASGRRDGEVPVIEIDLGRNSYVYRRWSSENPADRTTILGVPLSAYAGGRTAYIAGIASLFGLS